MKAVVILYAGIAALLVALWFAHQSVAPDHEPYAINEYDCETDMECYAQCLAKLPPNRPESECEIEL